MCEALLQCASGLLELAAGVAPVVLQGLHVFSISLACWEYLTEADVTGTLFGNNPGLTEADKRDLQQRGAIFVVPPSSDVPSLVLR